MKHPRRCARAAVVGAQAKARDAYIRRDDVANGMDKLVHFL